GFAEARILEMGTNCRPTLANNLPQIVAQDNFISINGLYRHGFLLAPSLAEEVITYLTNKTKQYSEIWS
ncbi:MAG: glycine oxidase, partial [Burkholderiales bacterium]